MGNRDKMSSIDDILADDSAVSNRANRHGTARLAQSRAEKHGNKPGAFSFAIGLRPQLGNEDLEKLVSELIDCCRFYVTSVILPVVAMGTNCEGDTGNDRGGQTSRAQAGQTNTDQAGQEDVLPEAEAVPDVIAIRRTIRNPVLHREWVKILDGMHSFYGRDETCWYFARTLAGLPPHISCVDDLRLVRAGHGAWK